MPLNQVSSAAWCPSGGMVASHSQLTFRSLMAACFDFGYSVWPASGTHSPLYQLSVLAVVVVQQPPADQSDLVIDVLPTIVCSLMEACFVFGYSADRADPGHSTDSVCDWLLCWISFPFPDTTRHRWCACPSIRYLRVPGARLLSHCSSPAVPAYRCLHLCTSARLIL